jgi:uncharacterized membrane protein
VLLAVLYGVPILFMAASPAAEALSVRIVDAALALALGVLFFIHSFTFSSTARRTPATCSIFWRASMPKIC